MPLFFHNTFYISQSSQQNCQLRSSVPISGPCAFFLRSIKNAIAQMPAFDEPAQSGSRYFPAGLSEHGLLVKEILLMVQKSS